MGLLEMEGTATVSIIVEKEHFVVKTLDFLGIQVQTTAK